MRTFRILCAWGLSWFLFVMMPVALVTARIQKTSYRMNLTFDGNAYCVANEYITDESIIACTVRIGNMIIHKQNR